MERLGSCSPSFLGVKVVLLLLWLVSFPAMGFSASSNFWSESAVQLAKDLSVSQREKLLAEDGAYIVGLKKIRIIAERVDPTNARASVGQGNETAKNDADDDTITKIVHFQRHGQGYHNLLGEVLREAGLKPSVDSMDPAVNPWLRPEIVDSPLTEKGKEECRQQCTTASLLNPELVVVSPLLRAIQTAEISFGHVFDQSKIPWVAHEGCREELGVLVCNKRRPLSLIQGDYPNIEFNGEMSEEDTLWHPTERESGISKSDRIYDFLVNFLAQRPESEIAVVGHSATLFHMCNAVIDCGDDLDLSSWFLTSEIRSIKLTFQRKD
jgi:broad specificity phosphatase PhoE